MASTGLSWRHRMWLAVILTSSFASFSSVPWSGATERPPQANEARSAAVQRDRMAGWKNYKKFCADCHGKEGGGDGPLAVMDPMPVPFSDCEVLGQRTDDQVTTAIMEGSKVMQGFKRKIRPEQVMDLIAVIRSFGPCFVDTKEP